MSGPLRPGLRALGALLLGTACSSQSEPSRDDRSPERRPAEVVTSASAEPRADEAPEAPPPEPKLPLRARLRVESSSSYPGWPATNAIDGDETTSWYSGSNDSVAQGNRPFLYVELTDPGPLRTVTILGNRDPSFYNGYAILEGQLDVFDGAGRLVTTLSQKSAGERHDFKFELPRNLEGVGAVRFTSTKDEGKRNHWGDVAIAEIVFE
ncbi:MAG: discoidin domain-containing protein [Myxococcales bacterium]|nr:discoidin domain-containing protein [Myxococcales bacterium]